MSYGLPEQQRATRGRERGKGCGCGSLILMIVAGFVAYYVVGSMFGGGPGVQQNPGQQQRGRDIELPGRRQLPGPSNSGTSGDPYEVKDGIFDQPDAGGPGESQRAPSGGVNDEYELRDDLFEKKSEPTKKSDRGEGTWSMEEVETNAEKEPAPKPRFEFSVPGTEPVPGGDAGLKKTEKGDWSIEETR